MQIKLNLKFIKFKDHFNPFFVVKFPVIRKKEVFCRGSPVVVVGPCEQALKFMSQRLIFVPNLGFLPPAI